MADIYEKMKELNVTLPAPPPKGGVYTPVLERKTSRKKFNKKVKEMDEEIRKRLVTAGFPVPDVIRWMNQVLVGYFHYYGITDNIRMLQCFTHRMEKSLFSSLNRRSQRNSYTWKGFVDMLKEYPLVKPRIYVSIYGD